MTLIYVRWRDAVHSLAEHEISELGELVELHEVGFLLKETDETVTLSIEAQKDATSSRMWLTIPRVNIVEIRTAPLAKAFPKTRRKKEPKDANTDSGKAGGCPPPQAN